LDALYCTPSTREHGGAVSEQLKAPLGFPKGATVVSIRVWRYLIAPSFRASLAHLDAVLAQANMVARTIPPITQMKKSDMTLPFCC